MKILELRFKNLNSLYDEWCIDFRNPEYTNNGIFILTGPTGAGKSTVLDAICLALYGATPRLGKVTSQNEIMSRQTGECYAEVLFRSKSGEFRCHWEQRRARKEPDGVLQPSIHQISDEQTQKPIETKKSLVLDIIEEKIGMDFDRFTRSILLAQGNFDAFLKAGEEQKSKILEQITGTEIYSEISRKTYERYKYESDQLKVLLGESSSVTVLTDEEENAILDAISIHQRSINRSRNKTTQIDQLIDWIDKIDSLSQEVKRIKEQKEEVLHELNLFKSKQNQLDWAIKAAQLDSEYAAVCSKKEQVKLDQNRLAIEEKKQPKLAEELEHKKSSVTKAEVFLQQVKSELKEITPILQKIRLLDQNILDKSKLVKANTNACQKVSAEILSSRQNKKHLDEEYKKEIQKVEDADRYLANNVNDEWLVGGFAGVENKLNNLLSLHDEIKQKKQKYQDIKQEYAEDLQKIEDHAQERESLNRRKEHAQKLLRKVDEKLDQILKGKLLREYQFEKDSLLREIAFHSKIATLSDYRKKLQDDSPCPLCGALEHPFTQGSIPEKDEAEKRIEVIDNIIDQVALQEKNTEQLKKSQEELQTHWMGFEKQELMLFNKKEQKEQTLSDLDNELNLLHSRFTAIKSDTLKSMKPLGISDFVASDAQELIEALKLRLKLWQENIQIKKDIEQKINELKNKQAQIDAVISSQESNLFDQEKKLADIKAEYEMLCLSRSEVFAEKSPDTEEYKVNQRILQAEENDKKEKMAYQEIERQYQLVINNVAVLKDRVLDGEQSLNDLYDGFNQAYQRLGFVSEDSFINARLSINDRLQLENRANSLANQKLAVETKQKDRENQLQEETKKQLTEQSVEELQSEKERLKRNEIQFNELIGQLKNKRDENDLVKLKLKEKQSMIDAQRKELSKWEVLNNLIGSADGKKYRNFAQGLTFELMVANANQQLRKMTDRYLLACDLNKPLSLNVIDNDQAGEIRSTQNLSGGESFIVSLTLALGLSKMVSKKVQVDSLFLDEGFGTLDEESLETALQALSELQQEGKLIGIISHITALKDRIRTQIDITPISGGRSGLKGSGCQKI